MRVGRDQESASTASLVRPSCIPSAPIEVIADSGSATLRREAGSPISNKSSEISPLAPLTVIPRGWPRYPSVAEIGMSPLTSIAPSGTSKIVTHVTITLPGRSPGTGWSPECALGGSAANSTKVQ